ncbi:MAG: S8 family serine peptidase [Planctomycetes bacterium]|nr:S8 family serine peptidase [Planctomycetota bacterium]
MLVVIGAASVWPAAPAAASDCDSEIFIPPLHVCTADGLTTLTLEGAEPFHETGGAVHDVRVVVVPDSTILLMLWEEEDPNGACWPYYGVSYDGLSVSRVRETSYELGLRYAQFDPTQGEPAIPDDLIAPDSDEAVYLVQFVTDPEEAFLDAVHALGAVIYSYQANHAYLVRMTAETRQQVQGLPYVRAVVPFHPAYKSAEFCDGGSPPEDATSYNILVFEPGPGQMQVIAERVLAIGGSVDALPASGSLMLATLTGQQLREVVRLAQVAFVGRDSPPEPAVDIARQIGGAAYVQDTLGYTGEGVTAEVMDATGEPAPHVEYPGSPEYPNGFRRHGGLFSGVCIHPTNVMGIVFATGVAYPDPNHPDRAKGFLPGAGPQNRIVADSLWVRYSGWGRREHTRQLVDETLDWKAVFQSNTWGTPAGDGSYTELSSDLDDILCDPNSELFLVHAGGNEAPFYPEAVAKNVLTVGGIQHQGTLSKDDDSFDPDYPQGPTLDGRIKPDLVHFADAVLTTTPVPSLDCNDPNHNAYTEDFWGTCAATPITAGHAGLFFQMWHEGVFPGFGGGLSVFADAPHISTTKAMLINTAAPYPLNRFPRNRQGWGMVDLRRMYAASSRYLIVNETVLLGKGETGEWVYAVNQPSTAELRATLVYTDAPGNPWEAQELPKLKNDLDLHVVSPGGTEYWGNWGLDDSLWSVPNGKADFRNNVENVFVSDPAYGDWVVRVIVSELVEDGHRETPGIMDVDFALVVTTLPVPAYPDP